ncbi:MAG: diguanylate cyclase [Dactylosporangium sp.]|jgi:two-component system cell cycle response regulator|nr:diguanylate cyclase [Dactylosporangium sp.]
MTASQAAGDGTAEVRPPLMLSTWRRPPAWVGYIAAVSLMAGLYYLLPILGPAGVPVQVVVYAGVSWSSAVALLVGLRRHRPLRRAPWLVLAGGQAFTAAGEVVFDVVHQLLGNDSTVSAADPLYLAAYPLLAAGLLLLVRHRTPGWDTPSIIDAAIIAISAALLSWMFLISASAFATDLSALERTVTAAYPVMDLLLLAVAARLLLGAGVRTPAFRLLAGGLILLLLTDGVYTVQNLLGTYQDGNYLDAAWMLAFTLIGAAGLHPSMARMTERSPAAGPDATPGRLAVLAVAALLAPASLLIQYLRHAPMYVPLVTGSCMALFLLVIARMAALVQVQRHMAITDALTGLRTRRFLEQALHNEAARTHRPEASVGLLLLDVDHFKRVNDTHGHHGGDRVLCEVARRLAALVRPGDLVARYGGEEFAVLLPHSSDADLVAIGERVRRGIGTTPIAVDGETLITVTVSIGAALLPDHVETPAELTLTADRALYAAKESGRDRLVTAQPISTRS